MHMQDQSTARPVQETAQYRGKHFQMPELSAQGVRFVANPFAVVGGLDRTEPVVRDVHTTWDLAKFTEARMPVTVAELSPAERAVLRDAPLPRVLDLPIKFPGTDYRIPAELAPLEPLLKMIANHEALLNIKHEGDYYCYLTVDRGVVKPGQCLREAPCHVDGFQGARWDPKHPVNHTYSVSDVLSTTFYVQPFDFSQLDVKKHDFFWEMNRQVASSNSLYAWRPPEGAVTLMDAYTVHRGTESELAQSRTFVRVSYETRVFDRLGNAHNPMFDYDWKMVPRDIEELKLAAFDPESHPSLRVFPHQKLDGSPHETRGTKTQPQLRMEGATGPQCFVWDPGARLLARPGWVHGDELRKLLEERNT